MTKQNLFQFQKQFTQHIRHPKKNKKPRGVNATRMRVYNELLFNNIEDSLANCYPILKKVLGNKKWRELVRRFFSTHNAQTPYYRKIPEEFFNFIQKSKNLQNSDFIKDLVFYEWIELDLYLRKDEIDFKKINSRGNLLKGVPVLNSLSVLFHSIYPLHEIEKMKTKEKETVFHFYVAFRDLAGDVSILHLSPPEAQLLAWMKRKKKNGKELLTSLQKKMKIKIQDQKSFLEWGKATFQKFYKLEIVLGTLCSHS